MPYSRLPPWRPLLFAIIGACGLSVAAFLAPRLVSSPPLPQRPLELEADRQEERAEGEEAIEWRLMRMRDEYGQVPDGALMRATKQMDAMRAAQARQSRFSAASLIGWTSLGPTNVGGRVRSIAIHPNDANTIFAGSVGGGIWKTTNGGVNWSPVNDFMANLAVTSIVFTPTNPTVMYAATGEGLAGDRGIRGAGVFKSTDSGTTWHQLPSTANPNFYFTNRVAVSPDGTTVLAATLQGIYRSTDGGATFPAATLGGSLGQGVAQVMFDPNNSSKAVAGAYKSRTSAAQSTPAWYSTDGGVNWTPVPVPNLPDRARVELAYARSVANKVYASVNEQRGLIYVSTNGGQSYTLASSGSPQFLGGQGAWANALWVDPTNDQRLVVGGTDLYRSTNGGSTFTQISGLISGVGELTHVDNHAVVPVPTYDGTTVKTVFVANDGGVYKAVDITTASMSSGWTNLNNGLAVTQFYSVATNVATGSIVGGTQDNATLRTSGSATTWSGASGSDGGFVAHDPVNTNYYYPSLTNARVMRNEQDGLGGSVDIVGYWCDDTGCRCKGGALGALCQDWTVSHANFNAPVVIDPTDPNRLLVGADHLFVTSDPRTEVSFASPTASGPSWAMIKPSTGHYISAVAVSPTSSDLIAVGHNDGAVYVTTNGTSASPTWTKVDDHATALPDRMVTSLTFSAASANTLWVTFGGYDAHNVWESTDRGGGWSPVGGVGATALPPLPIYDLKILSTNERALYVATEIGLFASADGGATWTLPQEGPANVAVDQLAWLGTGTLVAATHGRGMFKATVDASAPVCSVTLNPASATLGASAQNGSATVTPSSVACAWTAVSNEAWLSVTSGSSGTGTSAVGYAALANPDPLPRRGVIRVAGTPFVVTQAAAPTPLPQPPSSLRVTRISGNTVTLGWLPPALGPPATGYVIEGGVAPGEVIGQLPLGPVPAVTIALPTGSFFLRVRTLAGGAASGASNEVLTPVNMPLRPSAPANLLGLVVGNTLSLAWTNTFTGGEPTNVTLGVSGQVSGFLPLGLADTFTVPGVPGGSYTLWVVATNARGQSVQSNVLNVRVPTGCGDPPQAVANFVAYQDAGMVWVNWDPPAVGTAPTSYVLNVTGAFVGSLPMQSRALSGAVPAGTYNLTVVAANACGSSAPTAVRSVVVP